MAFCGKCGNKLEDNVRFCSKCGTPTESPKENYAQQSNLHNANGAADGTADFDARDIENNKVMAILAYLSWLVLIPLFAAKDSKFAKYHTNQGLILAIAEIIYGIVYLILSTILLSISLYLYFIISIIGLFGLVFLVLAIIGIINAANGKAKELPVIGKYKILK